MLGETTGKRRDLEPVCSQPADASVSAAFTCIRLFTRNHFLPPLNNKKKSPHRLIGTFFPSLSSFRNFCFETESVEPSLISPEKLAIRRRVTGRTV